ncbi:MAG: hypothetical protein PHT84_04870, partial [Candidatus Pacebacteria bacterium]|nr:hypothetical protein [Candidatus Paceibacterota bacterium]
MLTSMIKSNYTCGIDIGTQSTRVVVIGYTKGKKDPSLLAVGSAETNGMRRGYITNTDQVALSIKKAITQAEMTLGSKIRRAFIS